MVGQTFEVDRVARRIRACNYLTVAQLYLKDNFFLERPLESDDIKPRLLGHWGTCPGINAVYANLKAVFTNDLDFQFILGVGHGFPALQANLLVDGDLATVDPKATPDAKGVAYICRNFSWPGGYPSHASPVTPGVIAEGGELGYALGMAYGAALGHPEKTIAVLIGDGEFETATTLASLQLNHLLATGANGKVIPILHLNGYKISAPTIAGRKSERELGELLRGFGYTPLSADSNASLQEALKSDAISPFIIYHSEKGATGPAVVAGKRIAGNYLAHQIPLRNPKTNEEELRLLERWLGVYHFEELFNPQKGFLL